MLVSDSETRGAKAHGRVRLDDGLEAEHAARVRNGEPEPPAEEPVKLVRRMPEGAFPLFPGAAAAAAGAPSEGGGGEPERPTQSKGAAAESKRRMRMPDQLNPEKLEL